MAECPTCAEVWGGKAGDLLRKGLPGGGGAASPLLESRFRPQESVDTMSDEVELHEASDADTQRLVSAIEAAEALGEQSPAVEHPQGTVPSVEQPRDAMTGALRMSELRGRVKPRVEATRRPGQGFMSLTVASAIRYSEALEKAKSLRLSKQEREARRRVSERETLQRMRVNASRAAAFRKRLKSPDRPRRSLGQRAAKAFAPLHRLTATELDTTVESIHHTSLEQQVNRQSTLGAETVSHAPDEVASLAPDEAEAILSVLDDVDDGSPLDTFSIRDKSPPVELIQWSDSDDDTKEDSDLTLPSPPPAPPSPSAELIRAFQALSAPRPAEPIAPRTAQPFTPDAAFTKSLARLSAIAGRTIEQEPQRETRTNTTPTASFEAVRQRIMALKGSRLVS
jgi:hypothetical protein